MTRYFLAVLFFTLMALPFAASATPLTDPGFEGAYIPYSGNGGAVTGAIAPGWSDNSSWAHVAAVYSADTTAPHLGASAQRIDVSQIVSGVVQISQPVAVASGQFYQVRIWAKGAPGTKMFLRLQNANAPYDVLIENDVVVDSAWRLVTAQGYVTTSEPALLMVGVSSVGSVQIDDAMLTATPGSPTPDPPVGAIGPEFFGMHVANFQNQTERNPGFEGPYNPVASSGLATITGVVATGWSDNSDWAPVSVAYSEDATGPHGGGASQKVEILAAPSGAVQLVQQLRLTPQRTYEFSVWLRGSPGAFVNVAIRNSPAPYNAYAQATVALSSTWVQTKIRGLVGDTGDVVLLIGGAAPETFWVDDAVIVDAVGKPVAGGVPWPPQPVGTLRLWDAGVSWNFLEPQRGIWDFSTLDAWVAAATAHGVRDIILTLGQSPAWASARPGDVNYNGAGAPAEPRAIVDWTQYVSKVAQRYRGKIRYYEIWNEPNDSTFYTGSVAKLVQLTKAASMALKAVDSGNTVITAPPYTTGYLQQYLAAGSGAAADVIGYHNYSTPPEISVAALANARWVMASLGITKPLWDTEGASGDATTPKGLAPAYLARKFLIDLAYGARRLDWYSWGPASPFCVATAQNTPSRTQTGAGLAFGTLQSWLIGATISAVGRDASGTWRMSLTLPGGAPAVIIWNPLGAWPTALPGGLVATQRIDLAGGLSAVSGNSVTARVSPALFK